jgi:dihydroneopterin aldolase
VRTHTAITLQGMRFHARIGVLPHEADVAQPVEIDVTVSCVTGGKGDVLDYRTLYALAAAALAGEHTRFLEDVAERVASGALDLPGVVAARVAVRKPHVSLPGPLAYAEAVVERALPTGRHDAARAATRRRGTRVARSDGRGR